MKTITALAAAAFLVLPAMGFPEEPSPVSLCKLLENAAAYNHKLVRMTGEVSRNANEFTISDPHCVNPNTVWLEFGGTLGSGVVSCCGVSADAERPSPLVVEGVETAIVRDSALKKFQRMTKRRGKATVTVIGRYFSGREQTLSAGTFWIGYGRLGTASLLVIQQVQDVARP